MRNRTLAAFAAAAAFSAMPASAGAHAAVIGRTPTPSSTVAATKSVKITFAEAIVTGTLKVKKGSKLVGTGKLNAGKTAIEAKFKKALADGVYTVSWTAMSDDGYRHSGSWKFTDD
jgi:methionine-rich copper-binding protein CopC